MKIKNEVALVTGSNRGIGKALVEALINAGAKKIYASARDISKLSIPSSNTEIVALPCDISDIHSMHNTLEKIDDVTLLINNAGVLSAGNILDVSLDDIKHDFETNFFGTLALSRALAPVIQKNGGGAIVNILTLLSFASMPHFAAYNASKAAAWSMTMSLRASLSDRNVKVHSVFPGAVDTDMLDGIDMPKTLPSAVAKAIIEGIENNQEDIFPDPMSQEVYGNWSNDHKAVERQFAQM